MSPTESSRTTPSPSKSGVLAASGIFQSTSSDCMPMARNEAPAVMVRMSVASPFHPMRPHDEIRIDARDLRHVVRHDAGRRRGGGDRSELRALCHELPDGWLAGRRLGRGRRLVASGLQVLGHLLGEHLHQAVAVERAHGAHVERRLAVGLGVARDRAVRRARQTKETARCDTRRSSWSSVLSDRWARSGSPDPPSTSRRRRRPGR